MDIEIKRKDKKIKWKRREKRGAGVKKSVLFSEKKWGGKEQPTTPIFITYFCDISLISRD